MRHSHIPSASVVAKTLRRVKREVAASTAEEFYTRHPEWLNRFGEAGPTRCLEDGVFHIEFLASAIEIESIEAFQKYVGWTMSVLESRHIPHTWLTEHLRQIETHLSTRLSSAEQALVADFIESAIALPGKVKERETSAGDAQLSRAQSVFLQAIISGNRKSAVTVPLEALRDGYPPQSIYVEIFQKSLYDVGNLWETNQITVADEHMATAITQFAVAQVYSRIPAREVCHGKVVITGVEGELHQVGSNIVADMLEIEGYDVRFLGTNMPDSGIIKAVQDHKADMLGISATMLFNLPKVRRLIASVRDAFGNDAPRIVLGGSAFRAKPDLFSDEGAEGAVFNVKSAVDLIHRTLRKRDAPTPEPRQRRDAA